MNDPLSVLGLQPGATPEEVGAAYRRLAKEWHPDRGGGPEAELRMAQINVAHDLLRAGARHTRRHAGRPAQHAAERRPAARRRPAGHWLAEPIRRALGSELLQALEDREPVVVVTPASLWKSPHAVLAATDHRLLWLLDDAISDRVHSLRYNRVQEISERLAWPRRRTAILRVVQRNGRRVTFADLAPATALQVVGHVRAATA